MCTAHSKVDPRRVPRTPWSELTKRLSGTVATISVAPFSPFPDLVPVVGGGTRRHSAPG